MSPRSLCLVLVSVVLALGTSSSARDARYKVIVHPDSEITTVSRSFLRDAYLKKVSEWGSGDAILPVDLTARFPERPRFIEEILKKTPAQLKNYWNQQIFSGKGVPPPEADSTGAAVTYVLANPGAIGYVPADADTGEAKVISVR